MLLKKVVEAAVDDDEEEVDEEIICEEARDEEITREVVSSENQVLSGMANNEAKNHALNNSERNLTISTSVPSSNMILLPWYSESHFEIKSEPDGAISGIPLSSIHPVETLVYRPSESNFSQASTSQQAFGLNIIYACDPVAREGIEKANEKLDVIQYLLL